MSRPKRLPIEIVTNLVIEYKVSVKCADMEWDNVVLGGIDYEHDNNQYSCYRYTDTGSVESKSFPVMNRITIDSRNYNEQLKHLMQPGLDWINEVNK